MKKRNIVVANWKMNPETGAEAKEILEPIKRFVSRLKKTEVVIAPSFVQIPTISKILGRTGKIFLGAQNVFYKNLGAYTGEVSAPQLKDFKVKYIILGHSERRALGESNEIINQKIKNTLTCCSNLL